MVFLPPVPALLARNASIEDPVADLRAACRQAVAWLVAAHPSRVGVLADPVDDANRLRDVTRPIGARLAEELLAAEGYRGGLVDDVAAPATLVLLNGSACGVVAGPGTDDERSEEFDRTLGEALRAGSPAALTALDPRVARELMAAGIEPARTVAVGLAAPVEVEVDYADRPFAVSYWVVRWRCAS